MNLLKAIHYINQFFGQVGGESAADCAPIFHDGLIGCSNILNGLMPHITITNTIVCGDNYITNHTQEALIEIFAWLDKKDFDIFFAGPAFMAGRYGVGCGLLCKAISERYDVPVITSMNEENPGVEGFKSSCIIFRGGRKATFMKDDITLMAKYGEKIATKETLLPAKDEGYFPRGIRREISAPDGKMAADRVIDMLLKKLDGKPYQTELVMPKTDRIPPAHAVNNLADCTIALVSSSGIVPFDNPDKIQSASAQKWGKYNIAELNNLPGDKYKTIHAGFDPEAICEIPDRGIPVDAMRVYEKEGKFAKLYDYYYVTAGSGTSQKCSAQFGREIASELKQANVDAVILTAT